MEYSVGSLADLITGSNTPNKTKVIKKQIVQKPPVDDKCEGSSSISQISKTITATESSEKFTKKRKLPRVRENEPSPKKTKNDENANRRINYKEKEEKQDTPEQLARTVFVGNLPVSSNTKQLKKFFSKYGKVESVRIRGVPVVNPKTPKKVAIIKKKFHPDRKSFYGFVRYEEREDAIKSIETNGTLYKDHHLRVSLCDVKEKPDESRAIFVGNLSFCAEEDELWKLFESCGSISSVRIVRDGRTGMGKGFGYVNFENADSVPLALEMENVKLKDRELRISICNANSAKKNLKKKNKPRKIRKYKSEENEENSQNSEKAMVKNAKVFQGTKSLDKKKKNKINKGLLEKKKMMKKVAPK